jgi:hypothetical protein
MTTLTEQAWRKPPMTAHPAHEVGPLSVTDAVKLSGVGERHQLPDKARQQGSEGTSEREAATRTLPTDCIPETGRRHEVGEEGERE